MEEVANKLVSEPPVLEGAALEELKALLDLQMKMFIEGLDELFAARDAKLDALCARSGACASGGSGVIVAAVAQEVIPDLELAAAATSTTYVEPCVANIGSPSNCSMEVPNHVIDSVAPVPLCAITAVLVPACTIAEEIVPDTDLVVAVSSATTAVPSDINIRTSSSCSTEFPSLVIDAPVLVPVCTVAAAVIPDPDHVPVATSAACIEPSVVSDELDATIAMSGHNDMASRHKASATSATTDTELFPDPIFTADACSAMGIELSTIHIGVPVACSTKCPSVFINITAPAAVYATAEVTLDLFHAPSGVLATEYIGIILSDRPDIIVDAGLPDYWMDIPVMLGTSCEVSAVNSRWFLLDWIELQPWPPPRDLKLFTDGPVLRPLPWPSFASGISHIQMCYFCPAAIQSSVILCYQYCCLSRMGIPGFLKIEPEQQHNGGSEVLRPILTAKFSEATFSNHIVDPCAAIFVVVDIYSAVHIIVFQLLARLRCDLIEEPVHQKYGGNYRSFLLVLVNSTWEMVAHTLPTSWNHMDNIIEENRNWKAHAYNDKLLVCLCLEMSGTLAVGSALFMGLKPPWPPPAGHNSGIMHVDLPMTSSSAQQLGVDAIKEEKCSEDFLAMYCVEDMQQKCGGVYELNWLKWNPVALDYYAAIAIGRVDCVCAWNDINFTCDAKEIVDYHVDKLQFSAGPVQVSGSSSFELGILMLSRPSTVGESATLLKKPWPPPVVYVQAIWGATWEKAQFLSLKIELQILHYYRICWNNDLAELKSALSIRIWHYSLFTLLIQQSEISNSVCMLITSLRLVTTDVTESKSCVALPMRRLSQCKKFFLEPLVTLVFAPVMFLELKLPWPPPTHEQMVVSTSQVFCRVRKAMGLYQFGQSNYFQMFCKVKAFRVIISVSVGFSVLHMLLSYVMELIKCTFRAAEEWLLCLCRNRFLLMNKR